MCRFFINKRQFQQLLQDAVVAAQFNNNRGVWRDTALFWAQQFAEAPGKQNDSYTEAFKKLCSMGFDKQKSLASLSQETFRK